MRVEDLTKFEGECPIIVVFSTYMDIRIPLTKKWKKIINEKEDKPNTYHNNLIDYISGQIELSGFNMKSIGNLLIKKIVFNENNYYRYNNIEGFPITINDLGYWDKNRVRLNEDFHTVRLFNTVSVYGLIFESIKQNNFIMLENDMMIGYFRGSEKEGQVFCDMITERIEKYEKRESYNRGKLNN